MAKAPKIYNVRIDQNTIFNVVWVGVLIFLFIYLRDLILILLTSIVISSFIGQYSEDFHRRIRIGKTFAVIIMYVLTVGIFSGVFYFFIPVLFSEIGNVAPRILEYFPSDSVVNSIDFSNATNIAEGVANNASISEIAGNFRDILTNISSGFVESISIFFGGLVNIILVAVISFYLSISPGALQHFLRIITPIHKENYVIDLWERSRKKIALWVQGQLLLGLLIGILTFLGLTLLGIEYALLLAVVAALMELIPFGIFLAAIPAVTIGFSTGGPGLALMVIALYAIIQQFEGYLIAPLVVQKVTGVSPLIVIISVLIGVKLAGFWGLILAIPVAVTILEYVNDLEKARLALRNKDG